MKHKSIHEDLTHRYAGDHERAGLVGLKYHFEEAVPFRLRLLVPVGARRHHLRHAAGEVLKRLTSRAALHGLVRPARPNDTGSWTFNSTYFIFLKKV